MEEFRKPSNTVEIPNDTLARKRKEAWKEMRQVIDARRNQKKVQPSNPPEKDENELAAALKKEREREEAYQPINKAISPASEEDTPTPDRTPASKGPASHENGWNQGDGRRAEQVVIYENHLPESVRQRIEPAKGTHFRFRNASDEKRLMDALSSSSKTAVYQSTGKKDVTITGPSGQLIGNIHFLHMNGPDIHQPDKYYVKLYLFNFVDSDALREAKQQLVRFFESFGSDKVQPQPQPSTPTPRLSPTPRLPPTRVARKNKLNSRTRRVPKRLPKQYMKRSMKKRRFYR